MKIRATKAMGHKALEKEQGKTGTLFVRERERGRGGVKSMEREKEGGGV